MMLHSLAEECNVPGDKVPSRDTKYAALLHTVLRCSTVL